MTVSLCVIAYNEQQVIGSLLSLIKKQTYPKKQTEIVLVDSKSTDSTRDILLSFRKENIDDYLDIQVLTNERGSQASGWNTAIENAMGDVIIRVDAHAEIPEDFIEKNAEVMSTGEYVCGGARPNRIFEPTPWKETLFLAESSMFGSSIASYRRESEEEKKYVNSLFHLAYRRQVFEKVGGFNEALGRTEDNELHYRIRQAGFRICQSSRIISYQYIRSSFSGMMKQKFGNGKWIGLTLGVCPKCLSVFHLVPLCFVLSVMFTAVLSLLNMTVGLPLLAALWGLYALADIAMTVTTVIPQKKHITQLLLPFIFLCLHLCYGAGTLVGIIYMPFWKARLDGSEMERIEEVKKSVIRNSEGQDE